MGVSNLSDPVCCLQIYKEAEFNAAFTEAFSCSTVVGGKGGSKEYSRLQKQNLKTMEENNLLRYKVELLLDMLAASNADCIVMQKELDALKKAQSQHR